MDCGMCHSAEELLKNPTEEFFKYGTFTINTCMPKAPKFGIVQRKIGRLQEFIEPSTIPSRFDGQSGYLTGSKIQSRNVLNSLSMPSLLFVVKEPSLLTVFPSLPQTQSRTP